MHVLHEYLERVIKENKSKAAVFCRVRSINPLESGFLKDNRNPDVCTNAGYRSPVSDRREKGPGIIEESKEQHDMEKMKVNVEEIYEKTKKHI